METNWKFELDDLVIHKSVNIRVPAYAIPKPSVVIARGILESTDRNGTHIYENIYIVSTMNENASPSRGYISEVELMKYEDLKK